jgi:tRNA(adenine34) deaminase
MEILKPGNEHFMRLALQQAQIAFELGEIPVGAVVVFQGRVIARTHNMTEKLSDVTAHAEILAITAASNHLQSKYLPKCTIYVTLEPCVMCAGAIFWSQAGRLVYGAPDEKRGFTTSGVSLHPKTVIESGCLADDSSKLLKRFFERLR